MLKLACSYAIVQMTPPALKNISWRYYIVRTFQPRRTGYSQLIFQPQIFMILNACFVPVIYFYYPGMSDACVQQQQPTD